MVYFNNPGEDDVVSYVFFEEEGAEGKGMNFYINQNYINLGYTYKCEKDCEGIIKILYNYECEKIERFDCRWG